MIVGYKWLVFFILGLASKQVESIPLSSPQVMPLRSVVKELNIWTFRGSVGDGRLWFVKFYVPWCRGCKRMVGQYDELAETFKLNKNIVIARFDCMQDEDMCERLGVDRTPTLKLFLNGTAVETYKADFYHVELMTPFLLRMLEKYMGDKGSQANGNGATDATAAGSAAGLNEGDCSKPAEPHVDEAAATCISDASESTAGVSAQSGSGIQATPFEPGAYNRLSEATATAMDGVGGGTGVGCEEESGVLHTAAPDAPAECSPRVSVVCVEEVVVTTMAASPAATDGDSVRSSGGAEPLTRCGRHGGLAMETLQREKEEL